ncbi:MAG TPA: hypothetical protein VGJ96_08985 [Gemmatimonadaceae bacterium]|jgi:hypothetical protein
MKNHRHSMIPAAAGLILLLSGATATALAQAPSPSPDKMPQHQAGMREMKDMSGMESQPHHVLAMAYRANLETFARALLASSTKAKAVDVDIARPAVAEMRRSFEQMLQHHQAQMTTMGDKPMSGMMMGDKMMGDKTKPPMSGTMQDMQSHLAALDEHLTALESAVNVGTPDAKVVSAHTTAILKQCDKMSAKPAKTAKTAPHHMK